jgi:hypothetical protein
MPGGDRTGPMGQGPRTGRGAGYCGDRDEPGFTTAPGRRGGFGRWSGGFGRGRGMGFGAGRGFRRMGWGGWFGPPAPPLDSRELRDDDESAHLRTQIEALEARLARLENKQ